jgi:hypothetical protein
MAENVVASVVSLAKTIIMGLDRTQITTTLPTATLDLLCRTLIDIGQRDNNTARAVQNAHAAFLQAKTTGAESR